MAISITINPNIFHIIPGSIASIGGSDYTCRDGSTPDLNPKVIPGVIGAPSSVTSIQVANLLKLFKIPQVRLFLRYQRGITKDGFSGVYFSILFLGLLLLYLT